MKQITRKQLERIIELQNKIINEQNDQFSIIEDINPDGIFGFVDDETYQNNYDECEKEISKYNKELNEIKGEL